MNAAEWIAIATDLQHWREKDVQALCVDYRVPGPTYADNVQGPYRHNPGVSFVQVHGDGQILWFVINPDADQAAEAVDMIEWLVDLNLPEFRGAVGYTDFSRWLWDEYVGADMVDIGGRYRVTVTREHFVGWLDSRAAVDS